MFLVSFRLSRKRIALGAVAFAAVAALGIAGIRTFGGDGSEEAMTAAVPAGDSAESAGKKKVKAQKVKLKANEDRVTFLQSFGWEVSPEPVEVLEVIIPEEFDPVYQEYNALQNNQGYDLTKYAGKRCKRYIYAVTNHPQGAAGSASVQATLLLYGDRLIGGDLCSTAQDGFMHGFLPEP